VVPYRLGTDAKDTKAWIYVNATVDISFLIDMALTFLSSFSDIKTGKVVDSHKYIAIYYLKSWFAIDLISILPLE